MRKVLFKRFAYEDDNRVRVFMDEREGYFHGLHIEGGGYDYAVIEDCITGENYRVEPCNYKFIPSDEKESIDWNQVRIQASIAAMQGIVSNYGLKYKDNHAAEAVAFADELINQLKNNPVK